MKVRKRTSMKLITNKTPFEHCGENSRLSLSGYFFCFRIEFYLT